MLSVTRNISIALALALPGIALASSDQAWQQFSHDIAKRCLDAAAPNFRKPLIAVDPTGTENYGVAIVYGRTKQKEKVAVICVMDKKTGEVELGTELGNDIIRIAPPRAADQADTKQPVNRQQQKLTDQQGATAKQGNSGGQDDDMQDDNAQQ